MLYFFPFKKNSILAKYRFCNSEYKNILDFGCGNGDFIRTISKMAKSKIIGVDFDPMAVDAVKRSGFSAMSADAFRKNFTNKKECCDYISLSHVIEHVFDPVDLIKLLTNLVKVNGVIYIETPNSGGFSRIITGRYWRGLETPRHIQIFSHKGIIEILKEYGYEIKIKKIYFVSQFIYTESLKNIIKSRLILYFLGKIMLFVGIFLPVNKMDYISIIATKK